MPSPLCAHGGPRRRGRPAVLPCCRVDRAALFRIVRVVAAAIGTAAVPPAWLLPACRASAPAATTRPRPPRRSARRRAVLPRHSRASRGAATKATASRASDAGRTGMSSMAAWARASQARRGDRDRRRAEPDAGLGPEPQARASQRRRQQQRQLEQRQRAGGEADASESERGDHRRGGAVGAIGRRAQQPGDDRQTGERADNACAGTRRCPATRTPRIQARPRQSHCRKRLRTAASSAMPTMQAPARRSRAASASRRRVASASPSARSWRPAPRGRPPPPPGPGREMARIRPMPTSDSSSGRTTLWNSGW